MAHYDRDRDSGAIRLKRKGPRIGQHRHRTPRRSTTIAALAWHRSRADCYRECRECFEPIAAGAVCYTVRRLPKTLRQHGVLCQWCGPEYATQSQGPPATEGRDDVADPALDVEPDPGAQ